jgi:biotin carboxylase
MGMMPETSFNLKDILFLIEPCFHGNQYIEVGKRIGCRIIVVRRKNGPPNPDDDLEEIHSNVLNPESIILAINRVISRTYYRRIAIIPGNEYCVPVAAIVNEKLNLLGNSPEAALGARNKANMRNALNSAGINCPKSQIFSSIVDVLNYADTFKYPSVVKPTDMACSMFVKLVYNKEQLLDIAKKIFSRTDNLIDYPLDHRVLVEEYVQGSEFSVELFLENGQLKFASVTEKQKGSLPFFVELGHVVPSSITTHEQNRLLINAAHEAALGIGLMMGPMHIELVLTDTGPSIIEIAARLGGDQIMELLKMVWSVDLPLATIYQAFGYSFGSKQYSKPVQGAAIRFLKAEPGRVTDIVGIEQAKNHKGVINVILEVELGDYVKSLENSEGRLGYVIAVGKDSKTAKEHAWESASLIKIITLEG